jgi:hypothetical protein
MPPNNALVLVIDRLHAGFVGAYGNTWIATPELNRLAADGFLFDRAMIDSPSLESVYRSYWQGIHALAEDAANPSAFGLQPSALLPRHLTAAGYTTVLLTDDPAVARHPLAAGFSECELIEMPFEAPPLADCAGQCHPGVPLASAVGQCSPAETIDETQLARFFAVAAERLAALPSPFVLWLHVGSLGRTWDAPMEFRNQYSDEDDPPLPETAAVPNLFLPSEADPDLLLGYTHSYAGQVSLLDACVGSLLESLAASPAAESTLVSLLGARGFPLGEHGRVGPCDDALYGELTQIPWLLRMPDGAAACERTQALVQPADLYSTIAEWCGLPTLSDPPITAGRSLLPLVRMTTDMVRDRAIAAASDQRAIATAYWYMRCSSGTKTEETSGAEPKCELFVKPDDRFEVNEVADRCVEEVAQLRTALEDFELTCQSGAESLPPLPASLIREWA